MKMEAYERFTGSYGIVDEKGNFVAVMTDAHYKDEKLARLMASAPELLEALECVRDSTAVLNHLDSEIQQFICYAIAKAKGEQQ